MKKTNCFKKFLMLFALTILIQNGAVIAQNTGNNTDTASEEGIAPCSDLCPPDESYN